MSELNVKIQINEFILGQGIVTKFEYVTTEEAKKRTKYKNVFIVDKEDVEVVG